MITKHFKKFALSAIIILTASLLSACGGSSPDFAPADQNAFNDKFVGIPVTIDNGTIYAVDINADNKFEITTGGTFVGSGDYKYTKTGKNTAEIAFKYTAGDNAGITCTDTLAFTAEISATYDGVCIDDATGVVALTDSGTFVFDVAPADETAFNDKFVGMSATLDYGTGIAVININNNNEFETVDFGIGTYTYTKTGENTAEIAFTYSTGMFENATCTDTLTFTTEISATYNGVCGVAGADPFYNDSGTFKFSGSN